MWKYTRKFSQAILPVLLILLLTGCTGSEHYLANVSDADLLSMKSEIDANGKKYAARKNNRSDAANRAIVSRVFKRLYKKAQPLCDYTGYTSCKFEVIYDESDVVNAYASESSKITMFRGLMQYLRNDEETAFVIAHEMGHHLANHNQEKTRNAAVGATISGVLTAVLLAAANQNNPNYTVYQRQQDEQTVRNMTKTGAMMGALSYSKEEEREADLLGQYLLVRSGYDLKKAERVLWILLDIETTGGDKINQSAFGESHPAGPERLAAWRNTVKEIRNNPSKLPYKASEQPGQPAKATQKPQKVALPSRKPE
ncbi:MAG: M48 family metalloprotease [Pseudomonadota bacterium]|nr:hypothetical protein [Pseudomonadota bacterium]QKK04739.1 MAG: M48 family metalloprotease [Pseudomonadota bacterium]